MVNIRPAKSLRSRIPKTYRKRPASFTSSDTPSSNGNSNSIDNRLSLLSIASGSSTLSYVRGAVGALSGRALARFGEMVLTPVENTLIRRDFKKLLVFLQQLSDEEKARLDMYLD